MKDQQMHCSVLKDLHKKGQVTWLHVYCILLHLHVKAHILF